MLIKNVDKKEGTEYAIIDGKDEIRLVKGDYLIQLENCNNTFPKGINGVLLKGMSTFKKWKVMWYIFLYVFFDKWPYDTNDDCNTCMSEKTI